MIGLLAGVVPAASSCAMPLGGNVTGLFRRVINYITKPNTEIGRPRLNDEVEESSSESEVVLPRRGRGAEADHHESEVVLPRRGYEAGTGRRIQVIVRPSPESIEEMERERKRKIWKDNVRKFNEQMSNIDFIINDWEQKLKKVRWISSAPSYIVWQFGELKKEVEEVRNYLKEYTLTGEDRYLLEEKFQRLNESEIPPLYRLIKDAVQMGTSSCYGPRLDFDQIQY